MNYDMEKRKKSSTLEKSKRENCYEDHKGLIIL